MNDGCESYKNGDLNISLSIQNLGVAVGTGILTVEEASEKFKLLIQEKLNKIQNN